MATVLILTKLGNITRNEGSIPMSRAERDEVRAHLDQRADVRLFEVIPSCSAERKPGAWGEGRMPEREEARFRAMATTL